MNFCDETPEERAARVTRLAGEVKAGTYRPDAEAVAEAYSAGSMVERAFSHEESAANRQALREYLAREQAQIIMGGSLALFTEAVGAAMALQFLRDWIAIVEGSHGEEAEQ